MSNSTPVSSNTPQGGLDRRPSRAARRNRKSTRAPRTPAGGSGDPAGAELDAHPWTDRLRRLGDAVLPRPLARAAHDDEVPVPDGEPEALAAAHRAQHERPRG